MAQRFHPTRDQIRYTQQQTALQFAKFLRAELAGQVDSIADLESETRELQRLLAR